MDRQRLQAALASTFMPAQRQDNQAEHEQRGGLMPGAASRPQACPRVARHLLPEQPCVCLCLAAELDSAASGPGHHMILLSYPGRLLVPSNWLQHALQCVAVTFRSFASRVVCVVMERKNTALYLNIPHLSRHHAG